MTAVTLRSRMLVAALAILSMLVHSGGDTASVVGISVGGVLLMLGLWTMFRIAAVGGFLMIVGISALFTGLDTMTDAQSVVFAIVGLFVPAIMIGWAALTAEEEHEYEINLRTRPIAIAASFAIICMASVPIVMILSGLLVPSISFGSSHLMEEAIMLLAASAPAIYLFSIEPKRAESNASSMDSDEDLA